MSDSIVNGIVLIARHGDRYENFQNPDTFDVSETAITPLGVVCFPQLLSWRDLIIHLPG